MILHPHDKGVVALLQSAHALVAFQIAEHWGNRLTPRPSPRPEVLVAVLLHDAGWDDREDPPRRAADGRLLAFDTIPGDEREAVWASAVERARVRGRYVAYLVSHHVSSLAALSPEGTHDEFLAHQESLRERLRGELVADPRYAAALSESADTVNRAVVRLADAIAVHLACGVHGNVHLRDLPRRGGSAPLTLTQVAQRTYRVRPWPLVGQRLVVSAEGRVLESASFSDDVSLQAAWRRSPTVRITWTLLSSGAPSD
jgi:hypothetical protein